MGSLHTLARVESLFLEAAVDPLRWDAAMEVAAEATDAVGAVMLPANGGIPRVPFSQSLADIHAAYVRHGWMERDERYRGWPIMKRRGVATDLDFMTPTQIAKHPYYQEFLRPHGLLWFAGVKVACADDQWILSIQRSENQGPFSRSEQRSLAELSKRLSGAVALARALGFARAEAALAAFQASTSAAVMFDRDGRVLRFNDAAERMLGLDVRISSRRLACSDREATNALNKAIHLLIREQAGSRSEVPVPLPRSGRRPLIAYPVRLSGVTADALNPCQAIVVIVDPDSRLCPTEAALRSSFRLSQAEVKLAIQLGSGQSLEATADTLGISLETTRSQLKSIFSKTGTHRQSELILLLARISSVSEASKER